MGHPLSQPNLIEKFEQNKFVSRRQIGQLQMKIYTMYTFSCECECRNYKEDLEYERSKGRKQENTFCLPIFI